MPDLIQPRTRPQKFGSKLLVTKHEKTITPDLDPSPCTKAFDQNVKMHATDWVHEDNIPDSTLQPKKGRSPNANQETARESHCHIKRIRKLHVSRAMCQSCPRKIAQAPTQHLEIAWITSHHFHDLLLHHSMSTVIPTHKLKKIYLKQWRRNRRYVATYQEARKCFSKPAALLFWKPVLVVGLLPWSINQVNNDEKSCRHVQLKRRPANSSLHSTTGLDVTRRNNGSPRVPTCRKATWIKDIFLAMCDRENSRRNLENARRQNEKTEHISTMSLSAGRNSLENMDNTARWCALVNFDAKDSEASGR